MEGLRQHVMKLHCSLFHSACVRRGRVCLCLLHGFGGVLVTCLHVHTLYCIVRVVGLLHLSIQSLEHYNYGLEPE